LSAQGGHKCPPHTYLKRRYKSAGIGFKYVGVPGSEEEANELRFELNGQMFFVNFVPEEGRWYCYAPTAAGVQRIPVSTDGTPFESFIAPVDEQAKEVVN